MSGPGPADNGGAFFLSLPSAFSFKVCPQWLEREWFAPQSARGGWPSLSQRVHESTTTEAAPSFPSFGKGGIPLR